MVRERIQETSGIGHILPRILLFAVIGLTVTLMASLAMALGISSGALGEACAEHTALCCLPGGILCGFLTAKCAGRRMLLWGAIAGAAFFLLLLVINVLFLPALNSEGSLTSLLASMGSALIGAILYAMLRR